MSYGRTAAVMSFLPLKQFKKLWVSLVAYVFNNGWDHSGSKMINVVNHRLAQVNTLDTMKSIGKSSQFFDPF